MLFVLFVLYELKADGLRLEVLRLPRRLFRLYSASEGPTVGRSEGEGGGRRGKEGEGGGRRGKEGEGGGRRGKEGEEGEEGEGGGRRGREEGGREYTVAAPARSEVDGRCGTPVIGRTQA